MREEYFCNPLCLRGSISVKCVSQISLNQNTLFYLESIHKEEENSCGFIL